MKRAIFSSILLLTTIAAFSQQKKGTVVYERTAQMNIRMMGMNDDVARTRTDKFELLFNGESSLYRRIDEPQEQQAFTQEGGTFRVMMLAGNDDVVYHNFPQAKRTESREFFDKTFIIEDSVRRGSWKISEETKTILGYTARKATTQRITERTMMIVNDGKTERKPVPDTANITVWYTEAIPVAAGPDYQGQFPGLILEIDVNNGRTTYKAIEVSPKVNEGEIKAPKGKKKYTEAEFAIERDKILEEVRANGGGGGNRTIIRQ